MDAWQAVATSKYDEFLTGCTNWLRENPGMAGVMARQFQRLVEKKDGQQITGMFAMLGFLHAGIIVDAEQQERK